ncbi:MAG: phosphate ABC transporter permease subunit PstC [Candidatus Odinarchaeum yellowstonii]|uniref:Phosphate transport system permease protein n=1 Tax=Odinarchaeota yellowstonii (strain LCB_4) TaxID=1841599 RepID=A0AAF0D268_ODILC|nr:MAG: phosphate ABC transporter permease subunit PstC [Candidatus Odinarchaeum yellowstonii]
MGEVARTGNLEKASMIVKDSSPKRNWIEFLIEKILLACGLFAVIFVILIFTYIIYESVPFFIQVNPLEFFLSATWRPESPTNPQYGLLPSLWGSLFVTAMALTIAIPIGVVTAMYISQVARKLERNILKPLIEILAGIPSVVYGFFALVILASVMSAIFGEAVVTRLNALNGAIILAVMALPTIISISEDALTAVPREYKEAALALGSSDWETLKNVTFPAAKQGVLTAILLGFGRAIGETMAVLMATGNSPLLAFNPLQSILAMTALIARDFGEVAIGSLWYHSIFAVALILLAITLLVNWAATSLVSKKLGWRIRR